MHIYKQILNLTISWIFFFRKVKDIIDVKCDIPVKDIQNNHALHWNPFWFGSGQSCFYQLGILLFDFGVPFHKNIKKNYNNMQK